MTPLQTFRFYKAATDAPGTPAKPPADLTRSHGVAMQRDPVTPETLPAKPTKTPVTPQTLPAKPTQVPVKPQPLTGAAKTPATTAPVKPGTPAPVKPGTPAPAASPNIIQEAMGYIQKGDIGGLLTNMGPRILEMLGPALSGMADQNGQQPAAPPAAAASPVQAAMRREAASPSDIIDRRVGNTQSQGISDAVAAVKNVDSTVRNRPGRTA
jgi:hypothetical protein